MQAAQKHIAEAEADDDPIASTPSNPSQTAFAPQASYPGYGPSGLPSVVPRPGAGLPAGPVPRHPAVMPRPGAGVPAGPIPADPHRAAHMAAQQPQATFQNPQQRPLGPNGHPIVLPRPGAGAYINFFVGCRAW